MARQPIVSASQTVLQNKLSITHLSLSNCGEHCNALPTSPFRNKGLITQPLGGLLQGRSSQANSSLQLSPELKSSLTKDMPPCQGWLHQCGPAKALPRPLPLPFPPSPLFSTPSSPPLRTALKGHPIISGVGWLKLLLRLHCSLTFPKSCFCPLSSIGTRDPNCTPNKPAS